MKTLCGRKDSLGRRAAAPGAKRVACLLAILLLMSVGAPIHASLVSVPNSILPILTVEVSRQDPAVIGEDFSIVYLIRNISDKPAYDIQYAFHVVGANDTFPFTAAQPETIEMLEPGASATLSVKFSIDKEARERVYEINGIVTCYDAMKTAPVNYSARSHVPISFTTVKPNLAVTELSILEEEPDTLKGFTVRIGLRNSSMLYDLRSVLVQFEGGGNFEVMEITNKKEIARISTAQTAYVEFRISAKEDRKANTVTLVTSYSYTNGTVDEKREELFIDIEDEEEEEEDSNGRRPQVIIKRYTLSKEQVLAGDRIDLTLEIENTNTRPVKNVLINFGVESISANGGSASGSTVFAPVGSSNTFHVDEIRGKSIITNTITFSVDSGAMARTYIVPVTITYEDEKGVFTDLSVRDNVNIPVTQQAKLSVTSMNLPSNANVGIPVPVIAEFVNSGKVDLADFSVRLDGDFDTMDASLYMAKLMIGQMTTYTGMVVPMDEGDKEGRLIVSYLDNNNQEVEEEYPFTLSVMQFEDFGRFPDEGMFPPEGMYPPMEEGNPVLLFLRGNWLPLLLGLAIFIQFIYIVRVKKKAKEAFFDE